MQSVIATPKLVTRFRSQRIERRRPSEEVLTTHSAVCPCADCLRETRVGLVDDEVVVYGSCVHLAGVERDKDEIAVLFREKH